MSTLIRTHSVYHHFETPDEIREFHRFVSDSYWMFHIWNVSIPIFLDDYWYRMLLDEMAEYPFDPFTKELTGVNWMFTTLSSYTTESLMEMYGEDWQSALTEISNNMMEVCHETLLEDVKKAVVLLRLASIDLLEGDTEGLSDAANRGELYFYDYNLDEHAHHLIATRGGGFSCTN